jgi:hypothetical protein
MEAATAAVAVWASGRAECNLFLGGTLSAVMATMPPEFVQFVGMLNLGAPTVD